MNGYVSPISLAVERITQDMREQHEQNVLHAVMQCNINVDREELIKALRYDRDQYQKGFNDGYEFAHTWISVADRLPETNHTMLVCTKNRNGVPKVAMAYHQNGFGWCGSGGRWNNVTHWMPLPNVPEEAK